MKNGRGVGRPKVDNNEAAAALADTCARRQAGGAPIHRGCVEDAWLQMIKPVRIDPRARRSPRGADCPGAAARAYIYGALELNPEHERARARSLKLIY